MDLKDAGFAGPLRLVSWVLFGIAGLFSAVLGQIVLSGAAPFESAMLIAPGFLVGFGVGFRYVARIVDERSGPGMEVVAAWVFALFGILIIAIGVFGFDKWSEGAAPILFGSVFVGVGWMVRKLFVAPKGEKWLTIPDTSFQRGQHQRRTSWAILVDENASDEEVAQKVAAVQAEQRAAREKRAAKRIQSNPAMLAGLLWLATGIGGLIALVLAIVAYFGDPFFWLPAAGVGFMAGASGFTALWAKLHQKKFGDSHLVLAHNPVVVGQTVAGEIETSIPIKRAPDGGFRVRLTCENRWKTTDHDGVDGTEILRGRRLWKDEKLVEAIIRAGKPGLIIPFSFKVPADIAPSGLGDSAEGIRWQVSATADVRGLDFRAEFTIPVIGPA